MDNFKPLHYDEIDLIAVDVQNDFCPGGSLAVDEGDLVVPALNKVIRALGEPERRIWMYRDDHHIKQQIIATRDWHPAETSHFSDNPNYHTTWPVHCVAGTEGAKFHPGLDLIGHHRMVEVVSKGTHKNEDAYSGFDGVDELGVPLKDLLGKNRRRTALIIGGLATDYCVRATVLDARRLGFDTFVLSDAIRGVNPETARTAIEEMAAAGAHFTTSDDIIEAYERGV